MYGELNVHNREPEDNGYKGHEGPSPVEAGVPYTDHGSVSDQSRNTIMGMAISTSRRLRRPGGSARFPDRCRQLKPHQSMLE